MENGSEKLDQQRPRPNAELLAHLDEVLEPAERRNPIYDWLNQQEGGLLDIDPADLPRAVELFDRYILVHDDSYNGKTTEIGGTEVSLTTIEESDYNDALNRFKDHPKYPAARNSVMQSGFMLVHARSALRQALADTGITSPDELNALTEPELKGYLKTAYNIAAYRHAAAAELNQQEAVVISNPFEDEQLLKLTIEDVFARKI